MSNLRRQVRELMVEVHLISPALAAYHVSQMDGAELERRMRMYGGSGVECRGSTSERAGNVSMPIFTTRDLYRQARRHSTLLPKTGPKSAGYGGKTMGKSRRRKKDFFGRLWFVGRVRDM